jgi:hypothetical protein
MILSPTGARALTIKQPWASLIAAGIKTVENRTWPVPGTWAFCGPLLIHAGKGFDRMALLHPEAREELEAQSWPDWQLPSAAVVAVAEEVHHHRAGPGCCASPFGLPDCWHWALSGVTALDEPVPATGRLGLWQPDAGLLAAVGEQLAERSAA